MSVADEDIILEGSLKRCKKYKLFKTKWIERYFVLHCRDRAKSLYAIDEYKSSRKNELKKRFNLEHVNRVESNLSLRNHPITCSSANRHHADAINWIFSIGFRFRNVQKDLFLVSKNDVEMSLWVNQICKLCKLRRQDDDIVVQEESSISGSAYDSSQSLESSTVEVQTFVENTPDKKRYHHLQKFKSISSAHSLPRAPNPNSDYLNDPNVNYLNIPETSSMRSRRTEDDTVSYASGPPVPPPRTRYLRYTKNNKVTRVHVIPASTSRYHQMNQKVKEEESSGETIKGDERYPDSVTSSEGITVFEKNGSTIIRRIPPPVDRTNKPKNLRAEEKAEAAPTRYKNLGRSGSSAEKQAQNTRTSSTYKPSDTAKRRNLDYFEPLKLVENSSSSTVANSTRSPTPSDIEYITVDVDRTLAFKQTRRAAQSTD